MSRSTILTRVLGASMVGVLLAGCLALPQSDRTMFQEPLLVSKGTLPLKAGLMTLTDARPAGERGSFRDIEDFPDRITLELLMERIPNTLLLSGVALILAVLLAVPLGTISAVYRYSYLDYAATVTAFAGVSIPVFWLAILLIILFSVTLGWLPSAGMRTVGVPASYWYA